MYQTIEGIAEYLEVDIAYVLYLIREKQISTITVDDEVVINRSQFDFFIKQRQKMIEEYQKYLDEPIPEDIDIKDEDKKRCCMKGKKVSNYELFFDLVFILATSGVVGILHSTL